MLPRSPPLPLTQRILAGYAVERIDLVELGTGVAAAEVGDAQIRPQQIRPVAQQLGRAKLFGDRFVPLILEKPKFCARCHGADLDRDWMSPTIIPQESKYAQRKRMVRRKSTRGSLGFVGRFTICFFPAAD